MAEFVSGVAAMVLEKLATETYQEIALARGLKKEVQSLEGSMSIINGFLKDAENKQDKNNGITEWLQQLKLVFLDASDALDEIECEALRNEVANKYGSLSRKVCRFFSSSNPIVFSLKTAHKIKDIKERIDQIASSRTRFGLDHEYHAHDLFSSKKMSQWETHSHVGPSLVIGRAMEREEIIDFLISPQSIDNGIDVIPIVGLGGIGKTTLAKLVYNDDRVKSHFDLKAWVYVSEKFDIRRIALEILKSFQRTEEGAGEGDAQPTLQQVQTHLRNVLHQKTFLIVMDDVWTDERKKWSELISLLLDNDIERNKRGSKIIITTRDAKVASITKTAFAPEFYLRGFSENECLQVFLSHAFRAGEEEQYPRLVKIGKEIVRKCNGVPLAVISLGCLLYSKVDESEWKKVRDSEIWELDERDDGILPALRLSYNHLPSQLKRCVSYCSFFPKGYLYSNEELIWFWLAHGLLQSSKKNVGPEDLGHCYINELLSRFFFQDLIDFDLSRPGWCFFKMHDLIYDLAISTMQSELAVVTSDFEGINERVRHLVVSKPSERVPNFCHSLRKVGTFGLRYTRDRENIIIEQFVTWICHQFKYLKVLDLYKSQLELLPDCFSKMKHLRNIKLQYCTQLKELPESMCKLQNLQKLDVWGCYRLQKLLKNMKILVSLQVLYVTTQESDLSNCGIWCLELLRYLYIYRCDNLISLPSALSHLTSLKKLAVMSCARLINFEEEQEDKNWENEEVKDLNLRWLTIRDLPNLTTLPRWLERSAKTMQHMFIGRCGSITALPDWMPSLTALEVFASDNPQLIEDYGRYGPECSKIARLSYLTWIWVGDRIIGSFSAFSFMHDPSKSNISGTTETQNDDTSSSA